MFGIGDFSRLAQVPAAALSQYAQEGTLRPAAIDAATGAAYYSFDQLALLPQSQHNGRLPDDAISIRPLAALEIASIRRLVPRAWAADGRARELHVQLLDRLAAVGVEALRPLITLDHTDEYRAEDLDVEAAVPVEGVVLQCSTSAEDLQFHELPAAEAAACLRYQGSLGGMEAVVRELLAWVGLHGYEPVWPLRVVEQSTEGSAGGDADVELQLPVQQLGIARDLSKQSS